MGEDMRYLLIALLIATVAEGSRVGVYRAWEAAQLRRATTELWTPADMDGLALWLDAADESTLWADTSATTAATNNGLVARWDDKSGNARHATQAASGDRPTRTDSSINGLTALTFALDSLTTSYEPEDSTDFQILGVVDGNVTTFDQASIVGFSRNPSNFQGPALRQTDANVIIVLSRSKTDSTSLLINTTVTKANAFVFSFQRSSGAFRLWVDGADSLNQADTKDYDGHGVWNIGAARADDVRPWEGKISEIIIPQYSVSDSDRQKLEGYLAHKWGLTGNLPANHPYKSAPPTK
jgi:hypothetical protein